MRPKEPPAGTVRRYETYGGLSRRAWLLRPIVVNQYGGKGWAGHLAAYREYATLWKRSPGTQDDDNFNSAPIDQY